MRLTLYRGHSRLSAAVYNSFVFTGRRRLTPSPVAVFAKPVRPVATRTAGFATTARARNQQATMSTTEEKPEGVTGQPAEAPKPEASKPEQEQLPPLSDHEFRVYNRLADKMEYFVRPPDSRWLRNQTPGLEFLDMRQPSQAPRLTPPPTSTTTSAARGTSSGAHAHRAGGHRACPSSNSSARACSSPST